MSERIGWAAVGLLVALAVLGPWLGGDPTAQDLGARLLPPSAAHWFGTDHLGRDLFARVVGGAGITLAIVVLVVAVSAPLGLVIGAVAGTMGGAVEAVLMRLTDIALALPRLVLALALVAALGPGIENAVLAIALVAWPSYARVARAEASVLRQADFILALRQMGAGETRIVLVHMLPLLAGSVIVRATLDMAGIVLTAAGLGFLGLGAQPPMPEWGAMVAQGRPYLLDQWWVATLPGAAILIVSLGFNLLGDGLRDRIDLRSRE
ncbi:MAG: ABC transporter permease [Alphaproteobacteria bacterium]|nr:ABC transporter permease [Alphaproteobacteria bacterium]